MCRSWLDSTLFTPDAARTVAAGTVIGAISVTFSVSLASIIFTGAYAAHLFSGIAIGLFSAAVLGLVLALKSSFPGTIGGPQDKVASIIAVMAASIAGALPAGSETLLPTLLVCMALSTGATALVLYLLGSFRLGNTVRFLPYAVVGGFLAGTGWLLIKGALAMMTGMPLELSDPGRLLEAGAVSMWLPGMVFALILTISTRGRDDTVIVPAALAVGVAGVYAWIFFSGTSLESARAANMILPTVPEGLVLPLISGEVLARVKWDLVVSQLPLIGAVVIVSALALLLYASSLEVATRTDIDLNNELKSTGVANALCVPAGGIAGFNVLSDSLLSARMGAARRATGLIAAGICAATLLTGSSLVSYFPVAVLGGLILHLGFGFIIDWLYDVRRTLPRHEYLLLLLIFGAVVTLGFLTAVMIGIVAAVLLFAVTYSRINVVRYAVSGADYRSSVARTDEQLVYLREHGGRIQILRLQGFIFFGTAYALTRYVRDGADDPGSRAPRFLVLDFQSVTGFDHATLVSLVRMRQLAGANGVRLIFAGLDPVFRDRLILNDLSPGANDDIVSFEPDLDHAVEYAENRLLETEGAACDKPAHPASMAAWLQSELHDPSLAQQLVEHMERATFKDGDALIRQGNDDTDLYFVETGVVATLLDLPGGRTARLHSSGPGTVIGDMTFYLGGSRSASVIAEGSCTAWRLSAARIQTIEAEYPELALRLHKLLSRRLARRVADTNRLLQQVMQ